MLERLAGATVTAVKKCNGGGHSRTFAFPFLGNVDERPERIVRVFLGSSLDLQRLGVFPPLGTSSSRAFATTSADCF
jgi:hypothetical protein